MAELLKYWKIALLAVSWVSGWGYACFSIVHLMKTYDVELSIQILLSNLIVHLFLPALLLMAAGLLVGMLYWHPPKWDASHGEKIARPPKGIHIRTNIVK